MNGLTVLFLVALGASLGLEYWLSRRQISYVAAHRSSVPDLFQGTVSLEAHQKAADYTVDRNRLGDIDRIAGGAILLWLTLGGGIEWIQQWCGRFEWPPLTAGVAVILLTLFIIQVLELPLSLYQTFVIEDRYGFNRTTIKQFAVDLGLQLLLSIVLGGPLIAAVLWVMRSTGSYWWLVAWAIVMVFSIVMSWAFPTFIAPLFNRFTPLADPALRNRIEALLDRCGFHSNGIFVMDGSRRSGHGNAYFTGIGDSKRIVFFDTLIDSLEHNELEAVLAHELGHFKRKHVLKMLLTNAAVTLIAFAVLGWLSGRIWFFEGLGVSSPSDATALLLFMLVAPVFTVFLKPVLAYFQRRFEFEADDFAASNTQPSFLISALVKLYRENASTLTPDPLYSAFHYSHPPAAIRIAKLSAKLT